MAAFERTLEAAVPHRAGGTPPGFHIFTVRCGSSAARAPGTSASSRVAGFADRRFAVLVTLARLDRMFPIRSNTLAPSGGHGS